MKTYISYMHVYVCTYISNEILVSHKREWTNVVCSNMDVLRDYHTKWRKSDRERQVSYDIIYMWNSKYDKNEPIYKTEIDSQT